MNEIIEVKTAEMADPWEKQDHETPRAFAAFKSYRDMPANQRSLRKAVILVFGKLVSSKLRQYQLWSSKYNWVARSTAWDNEVDRKAREDLVNQVKEMNKQHVGLALSLQQKAYARLKTMQDVELNPDQVLAFIINGTRMERLARGEPEKIEVVDATLGIYDYSKMSPADLQKVLIQRMQTLPSASIVEDVEEKE